MRGKIRNRELAARLRDFSGLSYGTITPTDIDAFIEFRDRVFIFIESKYGDSELRGGQRKALQRLVDALSKDRAALLIVAKHTNEDGDLVLHESVVTEYRSSARWMKPPRVMTVRQLVDEFLARHELPVGLGKATNSASPESARGNGDLSKAQR